MKEFSRGVALPAILLAGLFMPAGSAAGAEETTPAARAATVPETEIIIGGGKVAGVHFPVAGAVCGTVSSFNPAIRCLVESNANSSANLERLRSGLVDFAVVQSDWLMHAAKGSNLFREKGPDENLRAVMSLHAEPLTLIVRAGAAIRSVADLKGKRLNLGLRLTYQRVLTETMMRAFNLDNDDLAEAMELPAGEQFTALCLGEIDALAVVTAHPSPAVAEALLRCELRIVSVAGKPVEDLLEDRPELSAAAIPGGLYAGATNEIQSFGLRAVLVTRRQTDEAIVYDVTRAMAESLPGLGQQHPSLAGLRIENIVSAGIAAPLHEGAARFYREQNLVP